MLGSIICASIADRFGVERVISGILCMGALYPPATRATCAGWALGFGRIGQIGGPLIGGTLLGLGWASRDIFLAASVPAAYVAIGVGMLGWLRYRHDARVETPAVAE